MLQKRNGFKPGAGSSQAQPFRIVDSARLAHAWLNRKLAHYNRLERVAGRDSWARIGRRRG